MPELPEVETVRRGLVPVLEGRVIEHAQVRRPDLRWPFPEKMAERLAGHRVLGLRRRSKVMLWDLSSGETLLVHLGMTGRMLISGNVTGNFVHSAGALGAHDHVVLDIEGGARVTYNDARRFGAMDLWPTDDLSNHVWLAKLGPEPLGNEFNETYLAKAFEGRKAPVKSLLLDQRVIAGLGNIYVCEALFRTGISPLRSAGRIATSRVASLVPAIRDVLAEAIKAGGSSLRDYRQADGELGYFQHAFQVYDREDMACLRDGCGGMVRRIVQSGRSSFYCPKCQR